VSLMSKLDEPRGAEDLIYRANYGLEIWLYRVMEWLDDVRRQMHYLSVSDAVESEVSTG